jgi:hypothetical protein
MKEGSGRESEVASELSTREKDRKLLLASSPMRHGS